MRKAVRLQAPPAWPAMAERLHTARLLRQARQRRGQGRYDRETLRLFRRAAARRDPRARLAYLLFRRDLGHCLRPRHVAPLLEGLDDLSRSQRWRAAALLSEIDAAPEQIWEHVRPGPGLTLAAPRQRPWRDAFRQQIIDSRGHGIVVVGNAGSLIGSEAGSRIDDTGTVVRFNRCRGARSRAEDLGTRTSVWVASPGYRGPAPSDAEWVVLSGPDMCFGLRDWTLHAPRLEQGRPVLTVPLDVWRSLVGRLCAPPSAGVLMLAWLRELTGSWEGISAAGIGQGARARYHHAHRSRRNTARHDWETEAALVRHWTQAGLRLLDDGTPGSAFPRRSTEAT